MFFCFFQIFVSAASELLQIENNQMVSDYYCQKITRFTHIS